MGIRAKIITGACLGRRQLNGDLRGREVVRRVKKGKGPGVGLPCSTGEARGQQRVGAGSGEAVRGEARVTKA